MDKLSLPFMFGVTYWLPVGDPQKVTRPCPVCAGDRAITVILGTGERIGVPCEACGNDYDGPHGVIEEWEHKPGAVPFVPATVESLYDHRWSLRSTDGAVADWDELRATEAEALAEATKRAAAAHEHNMAMSQHKKANAKEHGWSIRYHRECIARLEREIGWHREKIEAKPKKREVVTEA